MEMVGPLYPQVGPGTCHFELLIREHPTMERKLGMQGSVQGGLQSFDHPAIKRRGPDSNRESFVEKTNVFTVCL